MKRIFLFVLTNLAVVFVINITLRLLGVDRFLTDQGLDLGALLGFCAIFGMGGSVISGSGKNSSLMCGIRSGSGPSVDEDRCPFTLRTPIVSRRRAAHSAARRSSPMERKASASARRSTVKREMPETAASRSTLP